MDFDYIDLQHSIVPYMEGKEANTIVVDLSRNMDTLNPDGMMPGPLAHLIRAIVYCPNAEYILFPDHPQSASRTLSCLRRYMLWKYAAMVHREKGEISKAMDYERRCDRVYHTIPKYARW